MTVPSREDLVSEASDQTELSDFGDTWFFANLDALIPALNEEARLSPEGEYGARAMITGALVNRLRHVELIKQHPEILDEEVNVVAIVTGLPRTGSTMLHRMLASAPNMTGVRWYEAQNYVPLPGEIRGEPEPRRQAAQGIMDYMLGKLPDLMSIHPMSIDQPDEEVIILGQLFSSTMMEASYYVPSYAAWLDQQDHGPAYRALRQILQSLQWQDPSRKGKSWVLKTPGHLIALGTTLAEFSKAKIVMTHRDPVATVPSYCSREASLYQLGSEEIDNKMIGEYWSVRLKNWLDQFMAVRESAGDDRFIDVAYTEQLENPVDIAARVLAESGIPMSNDIRAGMGEWIEANKREHRAPHRYNLADFDLNETDLETQFEVYRQIYL